VGQPRHTLPRCRVHCLGRDAADMKRYHVLRDPPPTPLTSAPTGSITDDVNEHLPPATVYVFKGAPAQVTKQQSTTDSA
jgi:hypothetical protein